MYVYNKDCRLYNIPYFFHGMIFRIRQNVNKRCVKLATFNLFFFQPTGVIEWCFTPLSRVFQSYHGDSSHYSCLSWVSPVLGWGSEVSCPRTLPRKNPEDPVRFEPRTPGLRVKHFTTEPRRTHPARVTQWWACLTHDLVVVSSIPG